MERPDSNFKEYARSAVEVMHIAVDAGKLIVADTLSKVDSWLADYGDKDE